MADGKDNDVLFSRDGEDPDARDRGEDVDLAVIDRTSYAGGNLTVDDTIYCRDNPGFDTIDGDVTRGGKGDAVVLAPDDLSAMAPTLLAADVRNAPPVLVPSSATRLLSRYLDLLREPGALPTPELRRLATPHLRDLLRLAYGRANVTSGRWKKAGSGAARLQAIKTAIDADAGTGLSMRAVAAGQHISPRYLQKLFKENGTTFTQFVVGRRLARAGQMLSDPRLAHHPITAIAFDSGFQDLSYFNRTFRCRFGCTPSEFRAASREWFCSAAGAYRRDADPCPPAVARHRHPPVSPSRFAPMMATPTSPAANFLTPSRSRAQE
jgi:AraC-like DNA-binding protein